MLIFTKFNISHKFYSLFNNVEDTILINIVIIKKNTFFDFTIFCFEKNSECKFIFNIFNNSKIIKIWF